MMCRERGGIRVGSLTVAEVIAMERRGRSTGGEERMESASQEDAELWSTLSAYGDRRAWRWASHPDDAVIC